MSESDVLKIRLDKLSTKNKKTKKKKKNKDY